jgi:autotransporter-associated beta strand protein
LTIIDTQPAAAGGYSVIISNSYGSVTSVVAQLTVAVVPPSITTQPQDLTLIPGQSATFSVVAFGNDPLIYQWYYNTNTPVANATSATLTLASVQPGDAGIYSVLVSNSLGSVMSSNAVLIVNTNPVAPVFITQPASVSVFAGDGADFTAAAVGPQPITYQWHRNGALIPGATSTTLNLLNVQPVNAGNYTVVASNGIGSTTSAVAVLGVTARTTPPLPVISTNQFNILDHGALGDGVTDNATAIQNTIDAAAAAGGGTVVVPAAGVNSTYRSGPISLASGIDLQINSGAMLQMLPMGSWPNANTSFITGTSLHDVEISGSGIIDGQGTNWWFPKALNRPDFIHISGSTRVLIQDVTLQNPPTFHLMLKGGNVGLTIQGITINTPGDSPNTDGMDVASTNVLVRNCFISDGDDNIEIGGSGVAADITVSNCTFGTGHGVSIGSTTSGGVHDLLVSNCTFNGTRYGLRLKSDNDRGGVVQALRYLDLGMTNVNYPIVLYSYYNEIGTPDSITPQIAVVQPPASATSTTPIWRNITIRNLTATALTGNNIAGIIWGRPEMVVSNFTLSNVNITAPAKTFEIYNARGIQIIDSNLTASNTTANTLTLYNAQVTVTNSAASTNLVTLGGLAASPTNIVLAFYNAQASITDTNMLGAGSISLGGSTLAFTQSSVNFSNDLSVPTASTLAFTGGSNTFSGALSGFGPLTLTVPDSSLLTLQGNLSGFAGMLALSSSGTLRFNQGLNTWGDTNAVFDAGSSGTINNRSIPGVTIALGGLSGGAGAALRGSDQAGPGLDTYVVGGLGSNTTFAGTITNGTDGATPHTVALIKIGSGTFTLTGANGYSGGTTVSNGTLLVNNTSGSGTGAGGVTVASGATLGGSGVIGGPVIVNGSLAPGNNGVGILTISNSLVVNGGAVLQYGLGTNACRTVVTGNLTLGGTLNINDAGGLTTGVYTLVTYSGTLTYNGVTIGTTPSGNPYIIDTNTAGQVKLTVAPLPSTLTVIAGFLYDQVGNYESVNSVAVLVADTGNNGFVDPQPDFPLGLGATWGADDRIVGLWDLNNCGCGDGALYDQTVVAYTNGIAAGQKLQLYWFPSLTLASNTVGVTYYGKHTDTNNPPPDGGDAWQLPDGDSSINLGFFTTSYGGSSPETAGQATYFTAVAPVAAFTASPTNGIAPLTVAFTDTSTGTITNRFWNFGDGATSNTTATSLNHTYNAGIYTVALVVSGPAGASTNTQPGSIRVLTPFAAWQMRYFGCTNCPQAAPGADPLGKGMSNTNQFLAGLNPTNGASVLRITSVTRQHSDVMITWTTAGGHTNVVQAVAGSYSTNFTDISASIVILGSGDGLTTNYLDTGAATNWPTRFYRIRLAP